jgi:hypothetical protein
MSQHPAPVHQIELRVVKLAELFNSMDPSPFHHCDLDSNAEKFIETWAMEYPQNSHFRLRVHIQQMPADDPTALITEAIHNYFSYKAMLTQRRLRMLLREGRWSLLIGAGFLGLCLLGADLLSATSGNAFLRVLRESLLIGGWVAMWRPLQIFLYEWWPLARQTRILRRLGQASVQVVAAS